MEYLQTNKEYIVEISEEKHGILLLYAGVRNRLVF